LVITSTPIHKIWFRRWCEDNDATDSACDLAALRAFFKREIDHFELKMPDDCPPGSTR
jgi:hypothetical protein